jgi:hypothetical protein
MGVPFDGDLYGPGEYSRATFMERLEINQMDCFLWDAGSAFSHYIQKEFSFTFWETNIVGIS